MKAKFKPPVSTNASPARLGEPGQRRDTFVIGLVLAAITWFSFVPVLNHEFVNYDDDVYVYENPLVVRGLTTGGIAAAFTRPHAGNWHPLTTLSHLVDCELSGLNAGAHHRTNLLLHCATAVLLFLVLRWMTFAPWRSVIVAAMFAVHPLRVESVAWVAERKDVLSGMFFMLTLAAYTRYVRNPPSMARYLMVLLGFALGLMSKPMLVTLPFVLVLLDYWPLRRFDTSTTGNSTTVRRVLLEKLPLLVLSLVLCVVTLLVQDKARLADDVLSPAARFNNAVLTYVAYVGQLFYPANLAVFYPYPPNGGAAPKVVLALLGLIALSVAVFHWRRQRPYLLVGWLWYLGMLVPVIGLVQVGAQAHADRYTYLPQIGLCLALVWTVTDISASWRHRRTALALGTAISLGTLITLTRQQIRCWRDSETLWTHTLACTSPNAVAESNLANALFKQGRLDAALTHYQTALDINPDYSDAQNGLGFALLQKGQINQAINHLRQALMVQPESAAAHNNLGMALLQTGQATEAVVHLQAALKTNPDQAETHNNLGYALLQSGRVEEGLLHYQRALELKPDYAGACNNLAWALATSPQDAIRNGSQAVELATRAVQLSDGKNLVILRTLAAAHAEAGEFSEAVQTASHALELAVGQGNQPMIGTLRREISLYQTGQPLRDAPAAK